MPESGQKGRTVNSLASAYVGSNPTSPTKGQSFIEIGRRHITDGLFYYSDLGYVVPGIDYRQSRSPPVLVDLFQVFCWIAKLVCHIGIPDDVAPAPGCIAAITVIPDNDLTMLGSLLCQRPVPWLTLKIPDLCQLFVHFLLPGSHGSPAETPLPECPFDPAGTQNTESLFLRVQEKHIPTCGTVSLPSSRLPSVPGPRSHRRGSPCFQEERALGGGKAASASSGLFGSPNLPALRCSVRSLPASRSSPDASEELRLHISLS